ncbi:MAG: lamin tail domain-containing protein [Clostridia bacterium]|nr:lamin tail domain-containing protein [Clostridia bacterium]
MTGGERRQRSGRTAARKRSKAKLIFPMILVAAALVLLISATPWEPLNRATYTAGNDTGVVSGGGTGVGEAYRGLRISEIMPSNKTAVPDENGGFPDWVEVWNSGESEVSLKGCGLSDRGDSIRFLFPDIVLPADGRLVVYCDNINQTASGKPLHAKFKLSSVGETVYLYDPNAYLIDSVTYHILGSDTVWALTDSGYQELSYYSPGYPNTPEGLEAYRTASMALDGAIVINEIVADAKSGLRDEDGENVDWIELYNTTDRTVSLDNYALSNKENQPLRWRFPEGAVIAPHGYYLVFCSGKDRREDPTAIPHASFRISAEHDTVILADSRGRVMDRVIVDNLPEDCAYARQQDGSFIVQRLATPARDNSDLAGADADLRGRNATGVYISEIMASNDATKVGSDESYVDWVEIYNSGSDSVDISGWGLSDKIGRPRRWQFPAGTLINAGEYKVIFCDGTNTVKDNAYHTNFKVKRAGGETMCLCDPQGRVLDKLELPLVPTDISYGRNLGTSGFFYYDVPTPAAANQGGFLGYAEEPAFTVQPGLYYEPVRLRIDVPEDTTVYYTLDGSVPTQSAGKVYRGEELTFSFTTVLRARAFSDGRLRASETITGTFLINPYHTLPIVSVVCDPDLLWNETDGLLVAGPNVDKTGGPKFKNTIYRALKDAKYRVEGYIEYYELDGTQLLSQGMEFGLAGDFSLDMPQKSMKLRAKSKYGAKTFAAPLFEDRPYTEYKGLVLRNSGNDCMWTRVQDGLQSRMLDAIGSTVIHQAWKPVVVYLNGVYWGTMNLRERVDRFFVAQHEGLTFDQADEMVILQHSGSVKYGTKSQRNAYRNMISRIKESDPVNNPADLQYILDNVDVDNYFEYIALEMFVGNSDIGNIRWYNTNQPGSKWKWIFYDVDYGLYESGFNSPKSYTKAKGMGAGNFDNTILLKLLEVPAYRDKFLTKLGDIFQTFTTDYMLEILEPLVEQITPEMQLHWARWGEENDKLVITEVPTTADGAYRYWEKRVERLRNVIRKRPRLLWGYIQEAFSLTGTQMEYYFGPQPEFPEGVV